MCRWKEAGEETVSQLMVDRHDLFVLTDEIHMTATSIDTPFPLSPQALDMLLFVKTTSTNNIRFFMDFFQHSESV